MQAFGLLKIAQQGLLVHLLPPEDTSANLANADGTEEDGADGDNGARRALEHFELEVKPLHGSILLSTPTYSIPYMYAYWQVLLLLAALRLLAALHAFVTAAAHTSALALTLTVTLAQTKSLLLTPLLTLNSNLSPFPTEALGTVRNMICCSPPSPCQSGPVIPLANTQAVEVGPSLEFHLPASFRGLGRFGAPMPCLLAPVPPHMDASRPRAARTRVAQLAGQPQTPREAPQDVAMLLFVPCRTAMRGKFPLNGTYFQSNEVFLVSSTLAQPIKVRATVLSVPLLQQDCLILRSGATKWCS